MPRLLMPYAARPGEPVFERAVFVSRATSTEQPFAQLEGIRASALRNNAREQVFSAVLYQSGWFIYWLEGPSVAVRAMADRIRDDRRHHSAQVIHNSSGRRILTSPWSMGLLPSMETHEAFGERVAHMRYLLTQGYQFAPTSSIRRLSAPFGITFEPEPSGVEAFHRIGVSSASGMDSFSFVRWLGDQMGHPVGSRRMAGDIEPDSGSEYTEFYLDNEPVRIISMARNGLLQGLNRAFLCEWPHLVLLFCGESRQDRALMSRITDACSDLPVLPTLLCVAPSRETHLDMGTRAGQARLEYRVLGTCVPTEFDLIWSRLADRIRSWGHPSVTVWPLPESRMIA